MNTDKNRLKSFVVLNKKIGMGWYQCLSVKISG